MAPSRGACSQLAGKPLRTNSRSINVHQHGNVWPPPSTRSTWPLMNAPPGVHRKPTTEAISCGRPYRFERSLRHHLRLVDFVDPQEPFGHRPAGGDAVDRNIRVSQLSGQTTGVLMHGRLGDGIDRPGRPTVATGDAADRDDAAAASGDHLGRDLAATENRSQQVAVHHTLQIGEADVEAIVRLRPSSLSRGRSPRTDVAAGTTDERVDPAPMGIESRRQSARRRLPA